MWNKYPEPTKRTRSEQAVWKKPKLAAKNCFNKEGKNSGQEELVVSEAVLRLCKPFATLKWFFAPGPAPGFFTAIYRVKAKEPKKNLTNFKNAGLMFSFRQTIGNLHGAFNV